MSDLPTLIRASRHVIAIRALVCPLCNSAVELTAGLLICDANQGHRFATLVELVVKGEVVNG